MNDILLVDDDPDAIQLLGRILREVGNLRFATSGEDALRLIHESPPDVVLLDAEMPGMSGFEVCEAIKADPLLADVPVVFVSSHTEPLFEISGFDLGAADFIAKPVSAPLFLARVKTQLRIKQLADELRRRATVDVLTGVANRRGFDEALEREWRRTRRTGQPMALLMIDIDHFKLFNDRYGHPAGDACLRSVAQALVGASLRPADLVARYGGEEFIIMLAHTPRRGAEHVACCVLDAIDALRIEHQASPTAGHVSASVGIGCYDADSQCWAPASSDSRSGDDMLAACAASDLVLSADKALYCAKRDGRAQARLLDIADIDAPQLARRIVPPIREGPPERWPRSRAVTEGGRP